MTMLVCFSVAILIALSHAGNVSYNCKSEWTLITEPATENNINSTRASTGDIETTPDKAAIMNQAPDTETEAMVDPAQTINEEKTATHRFADFDLILPNLFFAL